MKFMSRDFIKNNCRFLRFVDLLPPAIQLSFTPESSRQRNALKLNVRSGLFSFRTDRYDPLIHHTVVYRRRSDSVKSGHFWRTNQWLYPLEIIGKVSGFLFLQYLYIYQYVTLARCQCYVDIGTDCCVSITLLQVRIAVVHNSNTRGVSLKVNAELCWKYPLQQTQP